MLGADCCAGLSSSAAPIVLPHADANVQATMSALIVMILDIWCAIFIQDIISCINDSGHSLSPFRLVKQSNVISRHVPRRRPADAARQVEGRRVNKPASGKFHVEHGETQKNHHRDCVKGGGVAGVASPPPGPAHSCPAPMLPISRCFAESHYWGVGGEGANMANAYDGKIINDRLNYLSSSTGCGTTSCARAGAATIPGARMRTATPSTGAMCTASTVCTSRGMVRSVSRSCR